MAASAAVGLISGALRQMGDALSEAFADAIARRTSEGRTAEIRRLGEFLEETTPAP